MATSGFGGFRYGRGVYGKFQTQTGAVVSSVAGASTIDGQAIRNCALVPSAWAENSTAAAHPIEAGRTVSSATSSSTRIAALHAIAKAHSAAIEIAHISGVRDAIGQRFDIWIETSRINMTGDFVGTVTSNVLWASTIAGRHLWEPAPPDPDPIWTPQPNPSDIWTPVPGGTSPWTPVHS